MNDELCRNNPTCMFATLLIGILTLRSGRMVCVNAGHLRPWILDRSGRPRTIDLPPDLPLGVMPDATYHDHACELGLAETFVIITDGVSEMEDIEGQFYTAARVESDLAELAHRASSEIVQELARRVQAFAGPVPAADDVTILTLRRLS